MEKKRCDMCKHYRVCKPLAMLHKVIEKIREDSIINRNIYLIRNDILAEYCDVFLEGDPFE